MRPNKKPSIQERGNALIFILIGIAMFTALAFTVSRGLRSNVTATMSAKEIDIVSSDILTFAQRVQRALDRVRRNGCSENDISFSNPVAADYEHTPAAADRCKIFHPDGGRISYLAPPVGASTDTDWYFYANRVGRLDSSQNIGTAALDLTMILRNVDRDLCEGLNEKLGNASAIWESSGNHAGGNLGASTKFVGAFVNYGDGINVGGNTADSPSTGCFCDTAATCAAGTDNYFYHVILAR